MPQKEREIHVATEPQCESLEPRRENLDFYAGGFKALVVSRGS